jgi:hypothetical protein
MMKKLLKYKPLWKWLVFLTAILIAAGVWHYESRQVNYSQLEKLLSTRQWMEADKETSLLIGRLLRRTLDDETFFGYSRLDFLKMRTHQVLTRGLPCKDLNIIDELWSKNSDGQFGFNSQLHVVLSISKFPIESKGWTADWENAAEVKKQLNWEPSDEFRPRTSSWYNPIEKRHTKGFLPSYLWAIDNSGKATDVRSVLALLQRFHRCKQLSAAQSSKVIAP